MEYVSDQQGHDFLNLCKDARWKLAYERLQVNPNLVNFTGNGARWSALHHALHWREETAVEAFMVAILVTSGDPLMAGKGQTPMEVKTNEECERLVADYMRAAALAQRLSKSTKGFELGHTILPRFVAPQVFPTPIVSPYKKTKVSKEAGEADLVPVFLLKVFAKFAGFIGKQKGKDTFAKIAQLLETELSSPSDAMRYQNFIQDPEDMTVPRRVQLIMSNPFFSSSLSFQTSKFFQHYGISVGPPPAADVIDLSTLEKGISQGGFVVTCLPPRPGVGPNTFFQRVVECLDKKKYLRFCLDVAKVPHAIPTTKFYEILPCGRYLEVMGLSDEQKECLIDTIGLFYAETLHAALHMFHYVMVGMLRHVANQQGGNSLYKMLADLYEPSVELKYNQVQRLLIGTDDSDGVLTKSMFQSDKDMLTNVMSDILADLGSCQGWDEAMDIFYPQIFDSRLSDVGRSGKFNELGLEPDMPAPGLPTVIGDLKNLAEALITPFSSAIQDLVDPSNAAGKDFTEFSQGTNNARFRVSSLKQWMELMSVTGMIHGTTLSMTRLFFLPQGLAYMSYTPGSDQLDVSKIPGKYSGTFAEMDFEAMAVALATIVGLEEGQEVFPDLRSRSGETFNPPNRAEAPLRNLFEDYSKKAESIRKACREKYQTALGDDFKKFGWMFSDYYDHSTPLRRQQTMTTYI